MASLLGSLLAGSPPTTLGLREGALAACPDRPNCVSTRASDARHAIAPFAFAGRADVAWHRLAAAISGTPGSRIVRDDGRYAHAEFTSPALGFVDDVEFQLDPAARAIHVRSASRLGSYDFGVNRARVEALRAAFERENRR
ncbi:MAG: DUF1499 domain-containing protein [Betaproteobacteria bacterium]